MFLLDFLAGLFFALLVLPGLSSGAVDLDAGSFELSSAGADLEAGGGEEGGAPQLFCQSWAAQKLSRHDLLPPPVLPLPLMLSPDPLLSPHP